MVWVVVRQDMSTEEVEVEGFATAAAARACFLRLFEWARDTERLLHFELARDTSQGVIDMRGTRAVLAVVRMGGLDA